MTAEAGRRGLLRGMAGFAALASWPPEPGMGAAVTEAPFPDGACIMVAGPDGGKLAAVSQTLAKLLAPALPPGTGVKRVIAGGADGVTVANQFDAQTSPDGQTLLMIPGEAALAWLAGDPRVHFEAPRWLPVMAGFAPAVMVGRLPPGAHAPDAPWRVAAVDPTGLSMAGLLAVDLIGARCVPVAGLPDAAAAHAALAQGVVDVVLVRGSDLSCQLAALRSIGAQPLFVLGTPDERGGAGRDPLWPELPDIAEYCTRLRGAPPSGPLYTAWRAAAAATQLDFAVVLPPLTTPALVAMWRRAAAVAVAAPEMQVAAAADFRPLAAMAATASFAAIGADAPALLELRRWLAKQLNWRPG